MKTSPLVARAFTIGSVALLLLIPIAMISGKVAERRSRAESVVAQFAAETTSPQIVAGPLLVLTCVEAAEKNVRECPQRYFAPVKLQVAGDLPVETRHRGLYAIQVYHATLDISGEFEWPAAWAGSDQRTWKDAYVVMQVSDARGIKEVRSSFTASRSSEGGSGPPFAIRDAIGRYDARKPGQAVPFSYHLRLDGTSSVQVAPVGDTSDIALRSNWPHPSFVGGMSPDERDVARTGFVARWRTTAVATGGASTWETLARKDGLKAPPRAAGVSLYQPVNVYTLSYRATEYGFLFILFTFAAFALVETLTGIRMHPIQYALVGSAIAVFFLLLLAISEHAPFAFAYATAASACVLLITIYLRHPLQSPARAAAFGAIFAGVYAMLYVLLLNEDNALLVGSLMVFALLAITMIATRKVDWSEMGRRLSPG